ncbi:MAG: hypothetical protein J5679_00460 [Alphaproteobacteria bacterium]|nr:hypothetical protein [Alphaproteobacteria bacterium]
MIKYIHDIVGRGTTVRFLVTIIAVMSIFSVRAEVLDIDIALNNTKSACGGISSKLAPLKTMAGINTGITGVGTAVNVGATVVGLTKAEKDEEIEDLLARLEESVEQNEKDHPSSAEADAFKKEVEAALANAKTPSEYQSQIDKLEQESKNLGNIRTGLMAGGTVTNVAGAVIAGKNKVDEDLATMIENCKKSVKDLRDSIMQARLSRRDIGNAENIIAICAEYDTVDLSKIDNRATGAMWSSIVGATTGAFGTAASVAANTDKVRDDNSDIGKTKEKNLNTASNVLAGTSAVASEAATVFNATQISAIKKVSSVADNCERELAK